MANLRLILTSILIVAASNQRVCTAPDASVLSVDQLIDNASEYASKIVNVRGEIVMDHHGRTLCDSIGKHCFLVVLPGNVFPEPDFRLVNDSKYNEYERLSIDIGSVQRSMGKAKLFATVRVRFDVLDLLPNGSKVILEKPKKGAFVEGRFVLQRVLKLDVQKLK